MTFIIEPQIERYINKTVDIAVDKAVDKAVDRAVNKAMNDTHQRFQKDMEHRTGILSEEFQSRLKSMGETIDLKIRTTTREVIQEEVTPRFERLETKVDMVVNEISGLRKEMDTHRIGMNIFKEEMRALRLDTNRHDKRITRLEHAIA